MKRNGSVEGFQKAVLCDRLSAINDRAVTAVLLRIISTVLMATENVGG